MNLVEQFNLLRKSVIGTSLGISDSYQMVHDRKHKLRSTVMISISNRIIISTTKCRIFG